MFSLLGLPQVCKFGGRLIWRKIQTYTDTCTPPSVARVLALISCQHLPEVECGLREKPGCALRAGRTHPCTGGVRLLAAPPSPGPDFPLTSAPCREGAAGTGRDRSSMCSSLGSTELPQTKVRNTSISAAPLSCGSLCLPFPHLKAFPQKTSVHRSFRDFIYV